MKKIDKSYLQKKINKLNKKIHRAESQDQQNKVWWRKMKINKLKEKLLKTYNLTILIWSKYRPKCHKIGRIAMKALLPILISNRYTKEKYHVNTKQKSKIQ